MRVVQKVTSNELTSREKKMLLYTKYTYITYIVKLFHNVVTTGIETLVSPIQVSKKSATCGLSCMLTSSIYSSVLLKHWSQVGKRVVIAHSDTRAARMVIKQLPVEILQRCSHASSCMWMHSVLEEHYTGCQNSTHFVLNDPTHVSAHRWLLYHRHQQTQTPWSESASELYRPSNRRLSAK
jgi:hypothetical protein